MSMSKSLVLIPVAALLMAGASWAQASEPDFGRPGWFVGVGAGAGFDFFEKAIEDATGGEITSSPTGSFNARAGYRVTSWFAFEGLYEGVYRQPTNIAGVHVADLSLHSFVGNFKFIVPTWRIHPYISVGPGGQLGHFNGQGELNNLDTSSFDFMLRLALGIDGYITENWLVNVEVAPSVSFNDWGNIPSSPIDNVTLTFGAGVQYRF
jgi:hypothetical protein